MMNATNPHINLSSSAAWDDMFSGEPSVNQFEQEILPNYLKSCRWFGGKARRFEVRLPIHLKLIDGKRTYYQLLFYAVYSDGQKELYSLAMSHVDGNDQQQLEHTKAHICCVNREGREGMVIDAAYDPAYRSFLIASLQQGSTNRDNENVLAFQPGTAIRSLSSVETLSSKVLSVEQSNTSLIYGNRFFLKLFRRVAFDVNPELEMTRFLTNKAKFAHTPAYEGMIQLIHQGGHIAVVGLAQALVPNKGDSWEVFLGLLKTLYLKILSDNEKMDAPPSAIDIARYSFNDVKAFLRKMIGQQVFELIEKLAERTSELHIALASDRADPDFRPEPIDDAYRKKLYKSLKKLVKTRFAMLEESLGALPRETRLDAELIILKQSSILKFFKKRLKKEMAVSKIRIHGDYHLGQVLFTGNDFFILDFEGEPEKTFDERRLKHVALKDIAGMIRSFHYAVHATKFQHFDDPVQRAKIEPWAELWYHAVSRFFLETYLRTAKGQPFIPRKKHRIPMLQLYLLEKSIYELGYEMNNRPDWLVIPIQGIKHFVINYIDA